jgi:hypothetical protein
LKRWGQEEGLERVLRSSHKFSSGLVKIGHLDDGFFGILQNQVDFGAKNAVDELNAY